MKIFACLLVVLSLVSFLLADEVPPHHHDDRCPKEDGATPTYLPHETDCHKFYECDDGQVYELTCLNGLYFNPKINVCDQPSNVDCEMGDLLNVEDNPANK